MTVRIFFLWEMLQLQLSVTVSLPLISFWIIYFSFYLFAAQQDAVNAAKTVMKRLPASCALQTLQGGGGAGGVAASPVSGQMLVAVTNPIQNHPLPKIPVMDDDDDVEVI